MPCGRFVSKFHVFSGDLLLVWPEANWTATPKSRNSQLATAHWFLNRPSNTKMTQNNKTSTFKSIPARPSRTLGAVVVKIYLLYPTAQCAWLGQRSLQLDSGSFLLRPKNCIVWSNPHATTAMISCNMKLRLILALLNILEQLLSLYTLMACWRVRSSGFVSPLFVFVRLF